MRIGHREWRFEDGEREKGKGKKFLPMPNDAAMQLSSARRDSALAP
jgi:hypothetical protein